MAEGLSTLTRKLMAQQTGVSANPDIVGATATIRNCLGEINGRRAQIEGWSPEKRQYTCLVKLSSGLEEIVRVDEACVEIIAQPPKKPSAAVRVQAAKYQTYFYPERPNTRLMDWWKAHLAAFKDQDEWLDKRGQNTMLCTGAPETDVDAVFGFPPVPPPDLTPARTGAASRVCFFVSLGGAADACGFATVDIGLDRRKCKLSMIFTAPAVQRTGVGLALLHGLIRHGSLCERSVELKFPRLEELEYLEAFYARVGFERTGQDEHYTHMLLER